MTRTDWERLAFFASCAASALVGLAFLIHGTIRDRVPGLSVLFYATPWPVIAAGAVVLALDWRRRGSRVVAGSYALLGMAALGLWLGVGWQWRSVTPSRGQLRVVQWNVDRPVWRLDGDLRWLAAQDADIITIAERHPRKLDTLDRWRAALPEYELVPSKGEMLCLVRGAVESVEEGLLAHQSFRTLIHARVRDHDVTVLQVDLDGTPSADRGVPLGELARLAGEHRSEFLIVLGDFNTPADSAFFRPLREIGVNAFEAAGSGCAATWPMPLPVLSLDQLWTTGRMRAVRCEHMVSWRSDHRAVRAEFDFVP